MAPVDGILLWIFGGISILGSGWAIFALRRALKSAAYKDDGLRMVFWTVGGLVGLVLAGMSIAYVVLPIIIAYSR